jgi:hypothetical protein
MKYFAAALRMTLLLFGFSGSTSADVVNDWNERAVALGYTARATPGESARNIAILHIACSKLSTLSSPATLPIGRGSRRSPVHPSKLLLLPQLTMFLHAPTRIKPNN